MWNEVVVPVMLID